MPLYYLITLSICTHLSLIRLISLTSRVLQSLSEGNSREWSWTISAVRNTHTHTHTLSANAILDPHDSSQSHFLGMNRNLET